MSEEKYYAAEFTDEELDALADAGDFSLSEGKPVNGGDNPYPYWYE